MSDAQNIALLNQLLAIEYRSLPMYLADADPWQHPGDEKAAAILRHIIIDQKALASRIAEAIMERGGTIDSGEFPMEYTDTHFLSLDFMLREMVRYQRADIARIERLAARIDHDRPARELALETLGAERAH